MNSILFGVNFLRDVQSARALITKAFASPPHRAGAIRIDSVVDHDSSAALSALRAAVHQAAAAPAGPTQDVAEDRSPSASW